MTTLLLLDPLLSSSSARIVNVASESHRGEKIHFEDLQLKHNYNALQAYGQSKLGNILFTYELARRLKDTQVTVNALHPGFVKTHLGKQNALLRVAMNVIHFLFAKSPNEGAETPIYLSSSPEVKGVTGKYFIDKEPEQSSHASYNLENAKKLWRVSEELCNLNVPQTKLGELETIQAAFSEHEILNN